MRDPKGFPAAPAAQTEAIRHDWSITGADCAACADAMRQAVARLAGVSDVRVGRLGGSLSATLVPGAVSAMDVERTVRGLGYDVRLRREATDSARSPRRTAAHSERNEGGPGPELDSHHHAGAEHDGPWYHSRKGRLVLLSGALLVLAWIIDRLTSPPLGLWAFATASVIGVAPVARHAAAAARAGRPFTIDSLLTIAALGALVVGAAEESAFVVFLFAVGELLEGSAAARARSGIRSLAALVPRTALVEERGELHEIAAEALQIGQTILVRPGERIPADGTIIDGSSGIDESPVTGESIPVSRGPGDPVFAGAINTESALRIEVTRAAADNTIARIIRLVEAAGASRAPTERFIDRFSRWYMPTIVGLALLVATLPPLLAGASWQTWTYRALALLLIGCPCALVISVPAAIASSLSSAARRGLLMKGGAVIEAAATVRHIAFDKTGTLTLGQPQVTDLVAADGVDARNLLATAAAVESASSHPLARAILSRAAAEGIAVPPATAARALPGKGVEAVVAGRRAWVGSPAHAAPAGRMAPGADDRAAQLEAEGKTVVAVWNEDQPLGLIAMRDEPRRDAADAMVRLRALGIEPVMLTGDNPRTAAAIANALNMVCRAGMLPQDKLAAIREMGASGGIMMVGDGINDAPALKQADVGVAMGSGTDVALETADAAILRNRLSDVAALVQQARATMANIRQNIAVALGLKAIFLVTSIAGVTGLWPAIMADTGATVLVTLNALRLLRYRPDAD